MLTSVPETLVKEICKNFLKLVQSNTVFNTIFFSLTSASKTLVSTTLERNTMYTKRFYCPKIHPIELNTILEWDQNILNILTTVKSLTY